MLSESQLLCAAQASASNSAIRDEFVDRFLGFLRYSAGRCCCLYKLDLSMIDDVVDVAIAMVFDGEQVRYNPARSDGCLTYLRGLVQNAAKQHARFIHRGEDRRQDWDDPIVAQLHLPTHMEEIPEPFHSVPLIESNELVALALAIAQPDERALIDRYFYDGESFDEIADSMGMTRSTVSRRLERFCNRAAAILAA